MVHPPDMSNAMTACVLEAAGATPALREVTRALPAVPPGHVLVKVETAGFCHHDALIMSGVLRRGVHLPLVLGHEVAGTIAAVGESVGEGWLGVRVVALPGAMGHRTDGAFAEYALVPWEGAVPLPASVPPEQAALLACPLGVAFKAVQDVAQVQAGETVVITGASGGLGIHAAQVAHALGATVLGVTGSPEKMARLEELPWLTAVLVAGEALWDETVRAMTDERGADVVVDTGAGELERDVRALAQGGRLVMLGQVTRDASTVLPAEVVFREARILGSLGAGRTHVERALALVAGGRVTPLVDRVLPLNAPSLLEAHRLLRERQVIGRVVLSTVR